MAKFRDIAKGMKLKLPGVDGQDMDFDFSDPDKMGSQLQSHVGNMMKGMMGKMPQGQQKLDMPGFSGSMDPQAMMKGMMDKMSNQAGAGNALRTAQSQSPEKLANLQKSLGALGGNSEIPKADDMMDFKPGNQSNLLQVDNPEYVARRAAALKKPGAVVGQTAMESAELTAMLRIAGLR
jgi:hypothetical protein